MNPNLTKIRQIFQNKIVVIIAVLVFLILAVITVKSFSKKATPTPQTAPLPVSKQPVINNKFDEKAQISQDAKSEIEKLKSQLPYRTTITTSTGNKITFVVFSNPKDPYTLYVETLSLNFRSDYSDPNLPRNVLDFRETAATIFDWLKKQDVDPADIFIAWGDRAYIQKNAEAWLLESAQYPKVIKKGNDFVFEKEPVKQ